VKALILNSGMGTRMGDLTSEHPKCMTKISEDDTIISYQLKLLEQCGINDIVITTGFFDEVLVDYCKSLDLRLKYSFVKNPLYARTNYIYSIYLARAQLEGDIVLMHGDLVFETGVLKDILKQGHSCMTVSSILPLPPKDFKAVIKNGLIRKIGIEFFEHAMAAQPLYKLNETDWTIWLKKIIEFCEEGQVSCYAENAFNEVSDDCHIYPMDFKDKLCSEVDTPEDLKIVKRQIALL